MISEVICYLFCFFFNAEKKKKKEIDPFDSNEFDESANLNDVEEYMEFLYDDTASKIKGSSMILQVARNPDNLTELAQNGNCFFLTYYDSDESEFVKYNFCRGCFFWVKFYPDDKYFPFDKILPFVLYSSCIMGNSLSSMNIGVQW